MRAIIYNRVSSDPTGRARSVADQERENRAVCERNDWPVAEVLTDNDRSATRFATRDRPEYLRLAEILRKGDVLVTWEASRAQRDLDAYVALRNLCAERGVMWCYSGKLYDLTAGDDRFTTGLDALLAEKEAEQTRERIMRGHRANLDAGRPHGHVPYGYRIVRDPTTGRPERRVPDEAQAPIVQDAARRILGGESLRSVVAGLNERTPEKRWSPSTLRRILVNPTYAGYRTHRGQIVREGTWDPLLSQDDHDRLVALFEGKRTVPRGSAPKYLLTGIAVCGVCDAPLQMRQQGSVPAAKKRPGGKLWFYGCEHGHVGRDRAKVDQAVSDVVVALLSDPAALATLAEPIEESDAEPVDDVQELRDRLSAAADAYDSGKLSIDMLAKVEARLLPRIEAAEARQRERFTSPVVARVATAPDPLTVWNDEMLLEDRREFLRATVRVVVYRVRSRWELGVEVYPKRLAQ
ncbi:integrase [Mycobacterium phage MalagasyRose]|uniref:Integrase n=1 Tax=Mycobacterium phage MalagasyRose TaxID=2599870 RepID=A0A5J6TDK3_9CAUD|nr:integrase [Mycobacterium phage MalagasyRose]QFG08890.1 integrase [Mycobacterium phage MalagasyRose]